MASANRPGSGHLRLGSHEVAGCQRFLGRKVVSVAASPADLAFFSARFSLRDFPDFFDMPLRGDLSDIVVL